MKQKQSKVKAKKPKKSNRLLWITEDLSEHSSFLTKHMFGCMAVYYNGLMVFLLADSEEPWRGALIPTDREHHPSLLKQFPDLQIHPVLKKWLYLPENLENFEEVSQKIVQQIQRRDPRFGIIPKAKK